MKKKLLSKMVALAAATVLVLSSNGLTAFAADGEAATGPKGDTEATVQSTGAATAEWDTTVDESTWSVTNDDDDTAAASDTQTDISIWAKVVEHGDIVYKVDISWGAMKFEFNNQAGKWNTESHTYEETDAGVSQEWTVDEYIDAKNNKITVTNHSNWAVDTTFSYAHEGTPFNQDTTATDAVRGHFFLTNEAAVTASKVLKGSATVQSALTEKLTLGHQDADNATKYGGTVGGEALDGTDIPAIDTNAEGSCTRYVYFTFNGTPDIANMADALKTDFTKVGVITVTIAPWEKTQQQVFEER